jgi:chorismate mutase/prephenate dehydrogenase
LSQPSQADPEAELASLRSQVDQLDDLLVATLARRDRLVRSISALKEQLGQPVRVPARERAVIDRARRVAEREGVSADLIETLLRAVLSESRHLQRAEEPGAARWISAAGPLP